MTPPTTHLKLARMHTIQAGPGVSNVHAAKHPAIASPLPARHPR